MSKELNIAADLLHDSAKKCGVTMDELRAALVYAAEIAKLKVPIGKGVV